MLRAVPSRIVAAATMSIAFRSDCVCSAIWRTCSGVMLATLSGCGVPDPFLTPAAFLMSSAAGGVFSTKVKDRSSYTEISTGITFPR